MMYQTLKSAKHLRIKCHHPFSRKTQISGMIDLQNRSRREMTIRKWITRCLSWHRLQSTPIYRTPRWYSRQVVSIRPKDSCLELTYRHQWVIRVSQSTNEWCRDAKVVSRHLLRTQWTLSMQVILQSSSIFWKIICKASRVLQSWISAWNFEIIRIPPLMMPLVLGNTQLRKSSIPSTSMNENKTELIWVLRSIQQALMMWALREISQLLYRFSISTLAYIRAHFGVKNWETVIWIKGQNQQRMQKHL